MKFLKTLLILLIGLLFLSGCNTLRIGTPGPRSAPPKKAYHKPGPPPHAPAHGYRHKHHDGCELEYDSRTGVYIVLNAPDIYFSNNLYIRLATDGIWMVSRILEEGWRVAVGDEVPHKLKEYRGEKKKKKKKKSKKGKGHKK